MNLGIRKSLCLCTDLVIFTFCSIVNLSVNTFSVIIEQPLVDINFFMKIFKILKHYFLEFLLYHSNATHAVVNISVMCQLGENSLFQENFREDTTYGCEEGPFSPNPPQISKYVYIYQVLQNISSLGR